jgi:DNA-directed RNA polymerase subunit RPC12/RpoP
MPEFETYTCENCGTEFKAIEDANAAENGYCSPKCDTASN